MRDAWDESDYILGKLDSSGKITDMNRAGLEMLGVGDIEEARGNPFGNYLKDGQTDLLAALKAAQRGSTQQKVEMVLDTGGKLSGDLLALRSPPGATSGVCLLAYDSTHDGEDEAAAKALAEADRIAALNAFQDRLNAMNAAQRAAALMKLKRIMDAWLQGSIRGYLANWKDNWMTEAAIEAALLAANAGKLKGQAAALALLQKIMAAWLQGSIRGFVMNWRLAWKAWKDKAAQDKLREGLNAKILGQQDRDQKKRQIMNEELEKLRLRNAELKKENDRLKGLQPQIDEMSEKIKQQDREIRRLRDLLPKNHGLRVRWEYQNPRTRKWEKLPDKISDKIEVDMMDDIEEVKCKHPEDGRPLTIFTIARCMLDNKLKGKGTFPVRRLQPLVEYVELEKFEGASMSHCIPTNNYAERINKIPIDPKKFRSGV